MILLVALALAQTAATPGAAAPGTDQTAATAQLGAGAPDDGRALPDENPYFPAAAMRPPSKHGPIAELAERLRLQPDLCGIPAAELGKVFERPAEQQGNTSPIRTFAKSAQSVEAANGAHRVILRSIIFRN